MELVAGISRIGRACTSLRLDELLGNIAGDLEGFFDGASLGNQALHIIASGQVHAFGELLDAHGKVQFRRLAEHDVQRALER